MILPCMPGEPAKIHRYVRVEYLLQPARASDIKMLLQKRRIKKIAVKQLANISLLFPFILPSSSTASFKI
jgi:hypothetical protein